jgi:type I restriction-modification system DNA methylase subunit
MSAEVTVDVGKLKEQPRYISLCDPTVGGGAMLIAAARVLQRGGINYQTRACFIGQDIDRTAAHMAYLQMSLLGMPGYVVVANTLSNPIVGTALEPVEQPSQDFWYTPLWFSDVWQMRRAWYRVDELTRNSRTERGAALITPAEPKPEKRYTFFFNFEEGEINVRA